MPHKPALVTEDCLQSLYEVHVVIEVAIRVRADSAEEAKLRGLRQKLTALDERDEEGKKVNPAIEAIAWWPAELVDVSEVV